jgi:hypothetical protein
LERAVPHSAYGETFDSHRLEESLIHVPHLSAAYLTEGRLNLLAETQT